MAFSFWRISNRSAILQRAILENPMPQIQLLTMPTGDAALIINNTLVASSDPDCGDPSLDSLATNLAEALTVNVTFVNIDYPENADWSWSQVLATVPSPAPF
jgi:hypothetical protein